MIINRHKILPVIEILLGAILLIREIYQMTYLPSIHDNLYDGLVDFDKYRENTYPLMFLWALLLIVGIISWINDNKKRISNTILIIIALCIVIISVIIR